MSICKKIVDCRDGQGYVYAFPKETTDKIYVENGFLFEDKNDETIRWGRVILEDDREIHVIA